MFDINVDSLDVLLYCGMNIAAQKHIVTNTVPGIQTLFKL